MGLTRTELFTEEHNRLAALAKALAHPARIAIVHHLLKANACINSDLVTELGLAQATISQHLKELKSEGIICGTIDGNSMNYCIDGEKWKEIQQLFNDMFNQHACCSPKGCH